MPFFQRFYIITACVWKRIILSVKDVSYHIAGKLLLSDVTFQVSDKQHIGLVGRNGTGKSTLFKLLNHQLQADDGKIEVTGNWKILSLKPFRQKSDPAV